MPAPVRQSARRKTTKRKSTKSAGSVFDTLGTLEESLGEGVNINLYGESGTGKTTLWATFPKPILALICSGGKNPGELRSVNTPEYRDVITPWYIESSNDISKAVAACIDRPDAFATVVLDHVSSLQDLILKELLGLEETPVQLEWGTATQQQWGQIGIQMKTRLRELFDLPQNTVIVAQERAFNTNEESSLLMPHVASSVTPTVLNWLNPACDYICQTFKRQKTVEKVRTVGKKKVSRTVQVPGVDYCLRVGPHGTYTTKFRVPKGTPLPEVLVDPSYDKIMELINGGN